MKSKRYARVRELTEMCADLEARNKKLHLKVAEVLRERVADFEIVLAEKDAELQLAQQKLECANGYIAELKRQLTPFRKHV